MTTPLLENKHHDLPSVFDAANLLREARRQKMIPQGAVPTICVLDPEGDLVRHLRKSGARLKGEADGNKSFLALIMTVARCWRAFA